MEDRFIVGKALKFMLTAQSHPTKPFFLILDEMNLSKVEHYFSDFLSCLESRISIDGSVRQEKVILYAGTEFIATNDDEFDEITSSIEIPQNLYITGTINVDETTYMFSPKVLDRANVIEFNEVNLSEYGSNNAPPAEGISLTSFPPFYRDWETCM